ncbi:hypothetical protein WJX84_012331 [Apatococcus fuscideae]|uniref:Uncharacterized protein n=1 Tax=Apatococcus fuscideae TaxID=2026836 RepID=A0AAW1TBK0_9CHLO
MLIQVLVRIQDKTSHLFLYKPFSKVYNHYSLHTSGEKQKLSSLNWSVCTVGRPTDRRHWTGVLPIPGAQSCSCYTSDHCIGCQQPGPTSYRSGRMMWLAKWLQAHQAAAFDHRVPEAAVQGNQLDVLKWLRQLEPPCELPPRLSPMAAASQGDERMLAYLAAHDCPFTARTSLAAAKVARWDLVKWLCLQGCDLDRTISLSAARQGRVDILEWLVEEQFEVQWSPMLCQAAVVARQLPALQWLRRHGCPGYLDVACKTASCNLDLPMLDWLAGSQFMDDHEALECCFGAIKHIPEQPAWLPDPVARCKELLQWFLSRRHLLDDSMQFEKLLCLKAAVQDALPILQMLLRGDGLDEPCIPFQLPIPHIFQKAASQTVCFAFPGQGGAPTESRQGCRLCRSGTAHSMEQHVGRAGT